MDWIQEWGASLLLGLLFALVVIFMLTDVHEMNALIANFTR